MVAEMLYLNDNDLTFQYSLCRVVLMVSGVWIPSDSDATLSVLALSSRFDGLCSAQDSGW